MPGKILHGGQDLPACSYGKVCPRWRIELIAVGNCFFFQSRNFSGSGAKWKWKYLISFWMTKVTAVADLIWVESSCSHKFEFKQPFSPHDPFRLIFHLHLRNCYKFSSVHGRNNVWPQSAALSPTHQQIVGNQRVGNDIHLLVSIEINGNQSFFFFGCWHFPFCI